MRDDQREAYERQVARGSLPIVFGDVQGIEAGRGDVFGEVSEATPTRSARGRPRGKGAKAFALKLRVLRLLRDSKMCLSTVELLEVLAIGGTTARATLWNVLAPMRARKWIAGHLERDRRAGPFGTGRSVRRWRLTAAGGSALAALEEARRG